MATATAEPPTTAAPKQADYSKVSNAAVSDWMSGLKAGETATGGAAPAPERTQTAPERTQAAPEGIQTAPEQKQAATATATAATSTEAEAGEGDKWPRSSADWKAFIKVRDENYKKRDARIKELEGTLAERDKALKGLPADPAAFETLKQERERFATEAKDLGERLRLAAIESHPRFKAYYDGKVAAQVELAKRVVGADKAAGIEEALRMPDSGYKSARLEELSADLSPVQASRLGGVLNAIEEIEADRRGEVARAKTDFEAAQAKATAEQTATRQRTNEEAAARFDAVVKQASDPKDGLAMFQTRDGDEAWNKEVKARIEGAKATLFGGAGAPSQEAMMKKALLAEAFPALLDSYSTMLTELAAVKAQVDKLTNATPTVQSRTATNGERGGAAPAQSKPGSRPMEVAADWIRGLKESSGG